jgi:hypothetical protein
VPSPEAIFSMASTTFLFGPVGLLLHGIVRAVRTRRGLVDEAAA